MLSSETRRLWCESLFAVALTLLHAEPTGAAAFKHSTSRPLAFEHALNATMARVTASASTSLLGDLCDFGGAIKLDGITNLCLGDIETATDDSDYAVDAIRILGL